MKINKKTAAPLIIIILAAAIGITIGLIFGNDKSAQQTKCELYFLNEAGTTLVSETREIKYHSTADLYENVVWEIISGPNDTKNRRVIEKGVDLISLTPAEEGNYIVNFSENFLTDDSTRNALAAYAVVKSLCEFPEINKVKVTIDGEDLHSGEGNVIDYLSSDDINLPSDTYTSETREISLYFPDKNMDTLYHEKRTVQVTDQQPMEQYIINELIKGPAEESLCASLSSSTSLLSVNTYGDICFVNFKSDFTDKNSGNEQKERMAIYSIVDSLTELGHIKRVQFLMDGKKVDSFGNMSIKNPFGRNPGIIY